MSAPSRKKSSPEPFAKALGKGFFDKFVPASIDPALEREWLAAQTKREARVRQEARKKNLEAAPDLELTDEMHDAILVEALKNTPSLDEARRWVSGHPRPWLVLAGGTGCGKSVAAAWLLAQHGGVWLTAKHAVRIFSASFGQQYDEQDLVRSCRLLFLDDVGTEDDSERMLGTLIELLEARKSQRRRTVMTVNLPVKKFIERYQNERLVSRMHQLVHWTNSKHPDMRRPERT